MESVEFGATLEEGEREPAAALYYEAFRQKLGPILGDRGPTLLAQTFHLDRALVARRGSEIVGLAGYEHGGRALVGIHWEAMRRNYGRWGGGSRYLALALFDRTAAPGELLMDGIVVAPAARGQGVGTELLRRVLATAAKLGLDKVRLDVVDTNPGARRLYERHGFEPVKTVKLPWLRSRFGFGASTIMVKHVGE